MAMQLVAGAHVCLVCTTVVLYLPQRRVRLQPYGLKIIGIHMYGLIGDDLVHDARLGAHAQQLADRGRHVGEDRQREACDRLLVCTDEVEQLCHVAESTRSKGALGRVV